MQALCKQNKPPETERARHDSATPSHITMKFEALTASLPERARPVQRGPVQPPEPELVQLPELVQAQLPEQVQP